VLFVFFLLAGCAAAQIADSSLSFEVASVKRAPMAPGPISGFVSGGRVSRSPDPLLFRRFGATLSSLLSAAYGLREQQIIGPDWLTTERYDILARAPEGATAGKRLTMLQNLLAERFGVKQHRETRDLPVYEMVVAKGGPKLKAAGAERAIIMVVEAPFLIGSVDGVQVNRLVKARGSLETLAARMSRVADRMILDRTGLKGEYDIDLYWWPGGPRSDSPDAASLPVVSLEKAFETQLGLRLEAKKIPVDVLVVDHAQKVPTKN
jgi:uncharacterized protein (TIGR03435 family)